MGTFLLWALAIIGVLALIRIFDDTIAKKSTYNATAIQENPVRYSMRNLNLNQRMSVVNMLKGIGVCDLPRGSTTKELQYLNNTIMILGVRADECQAYLKAEGEIQMLWDLSELSDSEKDMLIHMAWDMVICDGQANEKEFKALEYLFGELGISMEQFANTTRKTQAIMNYLK